MDEIVMDRERLRALLDAVVGIGSDLEPSAILDRIAAAAYVKRLSADERYALEVY